MEKHLALSDAAFESQFEHCQLPPSIFSHEAHLRLAWIHIRKYGITKAIENVQAQLQNFVAHVGAESKYNMTLTVAAVKAVHHFMRKSDADNFADFVAALPRLKYNFKELMNCHYGIDIFSSEAAKTAFLEPDLLPFE
ncbi:hypothetical protein [Pontibacter oryzae]|uniref:Uncharacterized protein n=1 Tax=Pontibacter oryzae TaxID=2304593 RepID=A0A399S026_9BACT|nr:hypothetical protein [Pontibacter oryzae]RIJ37356.1 hypothetical protein D1627_09465 [Pontibacter oryzae]